MIKAVSGRRGSVPVDAKYEKKVVADKKNNWWWKLIKRKVIHERQIRTLNWCLYLMSGKVTGFRERCVVESELWLSLYCVCCQLYGQTCDTSSTSVFFFSVTPRSNACTLKKTHVTVSHLCFSLGPEDTKKESTQYTRRLYLKLVLKTTSQFYNVVSETNLVVIKWVFG